jgi:hypothetical protein
MIPAAVPGAGGSTASTRPGGARTDSPEAFPAMAAPQPAEPRQLSKIQVLAVALVGMSAIGLAVYGGMTSYISVRDMAIAHNVPLAKLTPVGIDGGLLTVIAFDIVLTWIGKPLSAVRWLARIFSLGTIGANMLSGWPDPIAVGLHITPSVLLVIVVEGVREVLLSKYKDEKKARKARPASEEIEPIPLLRWLLAPFRTFSLWRRMVLWHVPSYKTAIDLELRRRQAVVRLRAHFGDEWRKKAPQDLVWMLRSGVRLAEACARVELIISPQQRSSERPEPSERPITRSHPRGRARSATRPGTGARNGTRTDPGTERRNDAGNDAGNGAGTPARNGLVSVPGTAPGNGQADGDDPVQDAALMAHARTIMSAFHAEHGHSPTLDDFTPLLGRQRQIASKVRRAILEESATAAQAVSQ